LDGDLLDDLDAEAVQSGHVRGVVGEQTDAGDAEVGEDLAAEAGLAQDALRRGGGGDAAAVEVQAMCLLVDPEAALGVVEVDERSAADAGDGGERVVDGFSAVAEGGAEDGAGEAMGLDADQNGLVRGRGEIAEDESEVGFVRLGFTNTGGVGTSDSCLAFIRNHAELAVRGGQLGLGDAVDVALVQHAVANKVCDRKHLEVMQLAEELQVRDAGHGAVVVHDFADDAGGYEAPHPGEVDGGFGLAGADEDAAFAGAEGEDVAGAGEVLGSGAGRDGDLDGVGAVGGGDAGGDAFAGLDGLSEGGAEAGGVVLRHGAEAESVGTFFGESEADEAAAVFGHEVDGFGRGELGGEGEVAFVFAVFVVDDDDHAAGLEVGDGGGDGGEACVLVGHVGLTPPGGLTD
jgi:hypothetical protein